MAKGSPLLVVVFLVWCYLFGCVLGLNPDEDFQSFSPLVTKESRRILVSTESGAITAVDVNDGHRGAYHLQFIALEPSSLFLPVQLHTDMVFYVHTGRGTVSWVREDGKDGTTDLDVERGDIYRIEEGSIFYVRSHPNQTREKLRIHAIFNTFNFENPQEATVGAYSNISDLVRGFDERVLQMGFQASEEAVQAIKWAPKPPSIVHFDRNETEKPNWEQVFEAFIGGRNPISLVNKKKKKKKEKTKTKTFNVYKESPDVENCNGWSVAVTNRDLKALKASDIGVFMVNLTKGSMMGPHWNPKATEIAVVLRGEGMVQVVCPSNPSGKGSGQYQCQNMRFRVKEGDVFIVPRFHPMAQMSFNNDSFVFMGFSTTVNNNHPQYLAGKWSVLRTIDREILAISFGASNTTIEKFLASQDTSVMLECTLCAEEAEKIMEEEIEKKKQEEETKRREEEEAKRREEEEARKREEEARKREEEEAKRREEEEAKRREEEEARKREEEEAKRREEEETRKREEEEEARRREEEETRKREEEEEARRREEEEEEDRKREEEEARKREEEEEARRREEEEARKREEDEEARRREEEEEEGKKREEEEEARKRQEGEEEETRREEEEEEEEEAARREEKEARRKEEEKEIKREEEEEAKRREEEDVKRQQKGEEGPDGRRGEETWGGERVKWRKMRRI